MKLFRNKPMHPRKNFKIRQYIASKSILHLTIVYVGVNAAIALLLATALIVITRQPAEFVNYFYYLYTELFGKEPSWTLPDRFMYQNIRAFLATLSLLSPAIFLGIVVYKFFVLKRDNIVFRSCCDTFEENGDQFINVHFYISSSLRLINLQFSAFLRTYEKCRENASDKLYPMNTFEIPLNGDAFYPLPYNYVPSRFRVKIKGNPMGMPRNEGVSVAIQEGGKIQVNTPERKFLLDTKAGDFCELYIIARGDVPDIQSHFYEMKCYEIPEALSPDSLPAMRTRFVREKDQFIVENWQDFENGKLNRRQRRAAKKRSGTFSKR